jgi:hypothetical protein
MNQAETERKLDGELYLMNCVSYGNPAVILKNDSFVLHKHDGRDKPLCDMYLKSVIMGTHYPSDLKEQ